MKNLIPLFFCLFLFSTVVLAQEAPETSAPEEKSEPSFSMEQLSAKEEVATLEKIESIVETVDEMEELCARFMDAIYLGDVKEAFEILEPFFPYAKENFLDLKEKTWQKIRFIDLKIGRMLGYNLVRKEVYGERVARLVYVARYQDYMFQWIFLMMKPDKTWKVKSLYWDEELQEIFN